MPKKIILNKKWIAKYAALRQIPKEVMDALLQDEVLSPSGVRSVLVLNEYNQIKESTSISPLQIKQMLASEYGMSASNVETIIYSKDTTAVSNKTCRCCGKTITHYYYQKNDGLCNECSANVI